MNIARLLFPITVSLIFGSAIAQDSSPERAVALIKEMCLSGTQYDLKVDANGTLLFSKVRPGADVAVSFTARRSEGAAAIFDEKIRQLADSEIRDCMKPHIGRIVDAVLAKKASFKEVPTPSKSPPVTLPPKQGETSSVANVPTGKTRAKLNDEQALLKEPLPSVSFVVGQDAVSSESIAFLRTLAHRLSGYKTITVRLVPYASQGYRSNPLSAESSALAKSRQAEVSKILVKAGLPSTRIVHVRDQIYGNTSDEIFDGSGNPLEKGLSVELAIAD